MESKLSITEIRFLRSLAAHKTDGELAEMINKPVGLIQMQFSLMAGLPKRPWETGPVITLPKAPKKEKVRSAKKERVEKPAKKKRISHAERKLIREQKNAVKEKEKREQQSAHAQEQERMKDRKRKLDKSKFKTRQLDLSDRIPVKLNAKTIIYVKPGPGIDIEELKKKYKIS